MKAIKIKRKLKKYQKTIVVDKISDGGCKDKRRKVAGYKSMFSIILLVH